MSEHFEDSMGQQELPCDKCGKCCYLMDKVDACYVQLLVAEVLRLREGIEQMADTWLNNLEMDGREKMIKMTNQLRELIE